MKVYTLIDTWQSEGGQMWIANFLKKEDCLAAFKNYLAHHNLLTYDGTLIPNRENNINEGDTNVEELFDSLLNGGWGYVYDDCGDHGQIFLRSENVQESYNDTLMPWN